ncbi:zinc ribbon domain-containing protein [soil metagenome]
MSKCPYCHFANEAGALFCEQCKSDLGWVEPNNAQPTAEPAPVASLAEAGADTVASAIAEPVHAAAIVDEPISAGSIPIAEASPVFSLADSVERVGHETVKDMHAGSHNGAGVTSNGVPEPALQPHTPPSTLDQVVAPGMAMKIPAGSKPKLIVLRGQRMNLEYQIYEGDNYIGRADDKAVDVDLEDQEPSDRIWSSRQHAVISYEGTSLTIEDLSSTNGTYLNRTRIESGKKMPLSLNDVIQIGTVQLRVVLQ